MRSLWWMALAFTLLWIWMEWNEFQQVKSLAVATNVESSVTADGVPIANQPVSPNNSNNSGVPSAAQNTEVPTAKSQMTQAQRIHVKTDVFDIEIDTQVETFVKCFTGLCRNRRP